MENGKLLHTVDSNQKLDKEWVELILEARNSGITLEEILKFFMNMRITP